MKIQRYLLLISGFARRSSFVFLALAVACSLCLTSMLGGNSFAAEVPARAKPYTIGVLAYKGKEAAMKRWAAHGVYLSSQLAPLAFEIVPLTYTNDELTRNVINRQVDFVITNPGHYTELEFGGHVSRIAARHMAGEEGVNNMFGGTAIARPQRSYINGYADLAGKKIRFITEMST